MRAVLISTYDLGRQPFGLASPAAWLREAGVEVACADLAKERLSEDLVRAADVVAFFLPMHTATRLALPVIDRVRELAPSARLVAYGLYAPLNASLLRERGIQHVLGGEFEEDLVRLARGKVPSAATPIPRLQFRAPDRAGLLPLARYATLQAGDVRRTAGYTEASRGCKHFCRHCPIVPVYEGRFRIVAPDIVMVDVRAQVAAGARHITFGDPDFFNGIRHAAAVIERFGRECPDVSYDVTIKVEHLLKHADMLPLLRDTGCAFVTSAVESVDDDVLAKLAKGHTRADVERVVDLCRQARLVLAPTFVAFTPWTTIEGYCDLLQAIDRLELVDHVASIQLAIRLLVPQGSRLLDLDDMRALAERFDPVSLTHRWSHPDPRVDELQGRVANLVGARTSARRDDVFAEVWQLAHEVGGAGALRVPPPLVRATVPYLDEPWYC
ncbi:MAG: radical SAM protein [Acidobacteria bacterium]|nr:radical SAM protein [Acidobacteriota bacterium]